jgi:hypothetical protein
MRPCGYTRAAVFALTFALPGLNPATASADPIQVSGSLSGVARFALVDQELRLAFPDFAILINPQTQLTPRFPLAAADGATLSLTQTLGPFSAQSFALPGNGIIDADVSGTLSFTGPTGILDVRDDIRFGSVSGPVQLTGSLLVTQSGRVLFDGSVAGSGVASVGYEERFSTGENRLAGYTYTFDALASTPEPTSLLLAATGACWVLARRHRNLSRQSGQN